MLPSPTLRSRAQDFRRWIYGIGILTAAALSVFGSSLSFAQVPDDPLAPIAAPRRLVKMGDVVAIEAAGRTPDAQSPTPPSHLAPSAPPSPVPSRYVIGVDGGCPGNPVFFAPDPTPVYSTNTHQERGMYVTAIQDFELCAIGMSIDLVPPQEVVARVYDAVGTTRGPLLASGTLMAVQSGQTFHYVPIGYVLEACRDYEITFEFGDANMWPWWNEGSIDEPFDMMPLRIRDGSYFGDASNMALPYFSIVGAPLGCSHYSGLGPPEAAFSMCTATPYERGVYVTAAQTLSVCAIGIEANLLGEEQLVAKIYESSGLTRGDLIAIGTVSVPDAGMQTYMVPIAVTLVEGHEYDLTFEIPPYSVWNHVNEDTISLPYEIEGAFIVRDGEVLGNAAADSLPKVSVLWSPGAGGVPFDMAKPGGPYPPPNPTSSPNTDHGIYITSVIDQNVYSLGWKADVPDGAYIGARVYEASGTSRGALLSEGGVFSGGPGMRWHDIPVSATLNASDDYDFEIDITQVNEWRWWSDTSGLPYVPFGVIQVTDGEQAGNPSFAGLMEMRMNGCSTTLTGIGSEPVHPPAFFLGAPRPNPTAGRATIDFGLDRGEPVTITVYNVRGQRVATVVEAAPYLAGPGSVELDTRGLAAGVYFIKLQTPSRFVSRKMVVLR